jgi:hypothetical protein
MLRPFLVFLFLVPSALFAGQDSLIRTPKTKIGHRFYIKAELLNTAIRFAFVPKTYDVDLQATVRLTDRLHLVNTYGKTTFYINESTPSITRPHVYQFAELIGTAYHRSSCMLRYYPFNDMENLADYLFVEGGMSFQYYRGITNSGVYDSTIMTYESQYRHQIDMYRFGPQVNFGLSYYFQRPENEFAKKQRIIFSPEFFVGVLYNHLYILKDEVTDIVGYTDAESYSEPKFRLTLRAKIGIGIF